MALGGYNGHSGCGQMVKALCTHESKRAFWQDRSDMILDRLQVGGAQAGGVWQ
jgi:hypothetical protein